MSINITYLKLIELFDNYDSTVQIGFFFKKKIFDSKNNVFIRGMM